MKKEIKSFYIISYRFIANIEAIRVFNDQIGSLADQHDRAILQKYNDAIANLLGINREELPDGTGIRKIEIHFENENKAQNEITTNDKNSHKKAISVTRANMNPEQFKDVIIGLRTIGTILRKESPRQGRILRESALTTLVSFFEILISELIQGYYLRYPDALPIDRTITLSELREFEEKEDAEEYILWKEIETTLRESTQNQLNVFYNRFKIKDDHLQPKIHDLIELSLRRNLLIHNGGVVNRTYIKNLPQSLENYKNYQIGETLEVSDEYLSDSISTVYTFGIILLQLCWRKWEKESIDKADDSLLDAIYSSLVEKRYDEVVSLAKFASSIKLSSDNISRIILINHAIALKESGDTAGMIHLLNSLDWSSCSTKFHIALYTLKDEKDRVYELLPKAIMAEEIDIDNLNDWPLFREIRSEPKFLEFLEKLSAKDTL